MSKYVETEYAEWSEEFALIPRYLKCGHWVFMGTYMARKIFAPWSRLDGITLSTKCLCCYEKENGNDGT